MAKLRVIFAGTPGFAAASLQALLDHPAVDIVAVYTQPDKPAGRGQQLRESAVKQLAVAHGLRVEQPRTLRDPASISILADYRSDLLVVAAYGQILPLAVLEAPRLGAINVHASLLPRWRGAAPIQRAIMAGDEETGITIMRVVEKLDAGPMLLARRCEIGPDDTAGTLHDRLAVMGGEALTAAIDQILADTVVETPQVEEEVTYASKIDRRDRALDWTESATTLARRVRALSPSPLACATLHGIEVNIVRAQVCEPATPLAPGRLELGSATLRVGTADKALDLLEIQPAGKRPMGVREFLNGYRSRLAQ